MASSDLHGLGQLGLVGTDVLGPGLDGALVTHPDLLCHLQSTLHASTPAKKGRGELPDAARCKLQMQAADASSQDAAAGHF
jgi:hypothetical protein